MRKQDRSMKYSFHFDLPFQKVKLLKMIIDMLKAVIEEEMKLPPRSIKRKKYRNYKDYYFG